MVTNQNHLSKYSNSLLSRMTRPLYLIGLKIDTSFILTNQGVKPNLLVGGSRMDVLVLPSGIVSPNTQLFFCLGPIAVQFQRPFLNWYLHSCMPLSAPSPIATIASGLLWHMARCLGVNPGILLHMTFAPKATTEDKALW